MIIRFETENGSVYHIDDIANTWTRISAAGLPSQIRTQSGPLTNWHVEIGKPAVMSGPPLTPGALVRIIETSPVVKLIRGYDEKSSS